MPWTAGAGLAAIGLALAGIGWPWLRRRRRFRDARQELLATVVAVESSKLAVRFWPADQEQQAEALITVPPPLVSEWTRRLSYGPPPSQDPDFEGPELGWNEIEVSYQPGGSPEALLSSQVEAATQQPFTVVGVGLLLTMFGVLLLYPPLLLLLLGSGSALMAVGFLLTRQRRPPEAARGVPDITGVVLAGFLGTTATLCFVGALQLR